MQRRTARLIVIIFLILPELALLFFWWKSKHDGPAVPNAATTQAGSMFVLIPHASLGGYHSVGPKGHPAWDISHDPQLVKQYGGRNNGVLLLRCNCGTVIRLLGQHVKADGSVAPSLWHDVPGCGWHVWGTLQGWTAGEWDTVAPPTK